MKPLKDISNAEFSPFIADEIAFGTILNPWPVIAEQRHKAAVSEGSYGSYFGAPPDPSITDRAQYTAWTYDAVREVLGNPTLFSSAIIHKLSVEKAFGRILVVMDPPEHTRYRPHLQKVFSPRAVKEWVERLIRPLVHSLIDQFHTDGSAELVSQYTRRFPFEIVFQLLDLPPDDLPLFHKLSVTQTFATTPFVNEALEAGQHLADYLQRLVVQRRSNPGEDLVTRLAQTEHNGERLSDEILVAFLRHILNAAADTSFRTTGSLLVALLTQPSLFAEVRADRTLIIPAIEEALRWEGPVNSNFRTLTRDYEMSGVRMQAGSVVYVAQGSANRDESYFENPDVFDPRRTNVMRHLGFGSGPHLCLGMHLARLQIQEAVNALLDRLPALRLDPAASRPVIRGFSFRAPPEIKVVF